MLLIEMAKIVKKINDALDDDYKELKLSYLVGATEDGHIVGQLIADSSYEDEKLNQRRTFDISIGHDDSVSSVMADAKQAFDLVSQKFNRRIFTDRKPADLPLYVNFDKLQVVIDEIDSILDAAMRQRTEGKKEIGDGETKELVVQDESDFLFRLTSENMDNRQFKATMYFMALEIVKAPKSYVFPENQATYKEGKRLAWAFSLLQDTADKTKDTDARLIAMMTEQQMVELDDKYGEILLF